MRRYKTMKKLLISLTCFIVIISCFCNTAFAEDEYGTSVCANNVVSTSTVFNIKDNIAMVNVGYIGYEGITTHAVITVKMQKKFLLFFWQDIDGASWTDYATGVSYFNSHSIETTVGTHRVIVEYTIYGSGGAADVITEEIEYKN